ncbi:hypothetical protein ACN38_g1707 [Penicillium nordicum]|uniref:Uncharacterized protein n=1 Tax=Penicillium nordicum TaxID=229535 RepID=A0A0M9WJM9_9EURO|nr:hypothetical protein ACN38_g1707 [Penicillium nordicum]
MMGDCRWRGEEKRKAFAKAKAERERERERESVRCLLNITKYGLYPTSIWRHLGGLYPFFSLFYSLIVLVIYLDFVYGVQLYSSFVFYTLQISLHLSSTPSVTLGTDLGVAT